MRVDGTGSDGHALAPNRQFFHATRTFARDQPELLRTLLGQIDGVAAYFSNDIIARAMVFGFVILVLIAKPRGLFDVRGGRA